MTTVHTDNAPAAIGPYSQAIIHGDTLYIWTDPGGSGNR